ncbi:hypothetical protein OS493_030157, partial [Desmophyllum pertusum]
MGGWSSQFMRHQSTTSPISSETQAIETPVVLREEMAARRPMETGEHIVSAAPRISLDVHPDNISKIVNSLQDAQEIVFLLPDMMEYQRQLEASITGPNPQ